jgi:hypothetical protein
MRRKELLELELKEMRKYSGLLQKQKQAIETGDTQAALAYCENEAQIINAISDYRKITPLTEDSAADEAGIAKLLADLRELQAAAVTHNAQNRELLKTRLSDTQAQLDALKNPYRNAHSIYANSDSGAGMMVQIEA